MTVDLKDTHILHNVRLVFVRNRSTMGMHVFSLF